MKTFLFCFVLLAGPLQAGPGFFPITEPGLPPPVVAAAKKAVRIFVFHEKPKYQVFPESIGLLRHQFRQGDFSTLAALDITGPAAVRLFQRELEAHRSRDSFFIHQLAIGSGFFIEGERFVTARHVLVGAEPNLQPYFAAQTPAQARGALARRKNRIILEDAYGNVIFDSKTKGQKLKQVHFSGHAVEAASGPALEASAQWQSLDYVVLQFGGINAHRRVLEMEPGSLEEGAEVFSAGFPQRTWGRKALGAPDADGASLRVTRGKLQPGAPADYVDFLQSLLDGDQMGRFQAGLVFSDLDFVPGLSGGPVLTAAGKVVSLASTVRNSSNLSPLERFSVTTSYGARLGCASALLSRDNS